MKPKSYNQTKFKILKKGKIALVLGSFISVSTLLAAPSGGVVTSGTANITQTGNITNINQTTQKASINWQKFNIATNESVNFNQPNVNSITLNRVIGNEKSIIDGALNANGQVWIVNANGILFDKNSRVNTAGLVASTKNITNDDFNLGWYSFKGDSTNSIINLGTIDIKDEGYAILLGKEVKNEGTIKAIKGDIHLVGADEVAISLNGNSLTNLIVGKDILDALVENKGLIKADGGKVYLTTNSLNSILSSVVNHSGIIEADSLEDISSQVEIFSHGGIANIDGKIISKDGFVETSGKYINISKDTIVKAKKWLIDPVNIIIESTGGDNLSGESISAIALQNALSSTNIELQADQDITVNENISWASDKQLRLTAGDEIYLNAIIENSNPSNGGVYFNAANTTSKVIFDTDAKVIIHNPYQLQWIDRGMNGNYELGSDIDASVTRTWNGGQGFDPIGFFDRIKWTGYEFNGQFDGKGHIISNLYIDIPTTSGGVFPDQTSAYIGLFGYTGVSSILKNIGLTNADIKGQSYVGILVGTNKGKIYNSFSDGLVNAMAYSGGFVGFNHGEIYDSYSKGTMTGSSSFNGGFVGGHFGKIYNSYSLVDVNSLAWSGGFVGYMDSGSLIENSYFNGTINNGTLNGSFLGTYLSGTIKNSFYNKEKTSLDKVVGKPGDNSLETINVKGLSDEEFGYGQIFKDASWDIVVDNTITSNSPIIKYDSENNKYVWAIAPLELNYSLNGKSVTYDGNTHNIKSENTTSTIFGGDYSFIKDSEYKYQKDGLDITGYKNAGDYNNIKIVSNNEFLAIKSSGNSDGALTITPKDITVSVDNKTKIYGDINPSFTYNVVGLLSGDSLTGSLTSSAVYNSNVGEYNITQGNLVNSNYNIATFANGTLTITPKDIIVSAENKTRMFGKANPLLTYKYAALVDGDRIENIVDGELSSDATPSSKAGEYKIFTKDLKDISNNYKVAFKDGILTVKQDNNPKLQSIVTNLVPTIQPPKIKAPKPQVSPPNTLAFTPKAKVNILGGGLEVPQGGMESLFSDEEN
jgi:filamentous hemagglutinin family protein